MSDTESAPGQIEWRLPRERELRLWAGVVLFAFVTTHLLNHALGVFGVTTMEAVQRWRIWAWQSYGGTVLLYGALLTHATLALKRLTTRRISRMPLEELVQIALGLAIPYFLISHVLGTRITSLYGYSESYGEVLARIWQGGPAKQILLLLCAWTHGCIGIGQVLRSRSFYARWRDLLILGMGMLPTLALAGVWIVGALLAGRLHLGRIEFRDDHVRPILTPIGIGLILVAIFAVGALIVREIPPLDHQVRHVLDFAAPGQIVPVLLITVVNGIAEELFFRGAVYAAVPRSPVLVSTIANTAVVLATGNYMLGFAAVLLAFVVGLERRASGGILGPILTHVTWSGAMLFVLPAIFS